jgi:hypothetical protein
MKLILNLLQQSKDKKSDASENEYVSVKVCFNQHFPTIAKSRTAHHYEEPTKREEA